MYLIDYSFVIDFIHHKFYHFSHFNSIQIYVNRSTILKYVLLISVMKIFFVLIIGEKHFQFLVFFGIKVFVIVIAEKWYFCVIFCTQFIAFLHTEWPHMAFVYKYLVHRGVNTLPLSLALLLFDSWLGTCKGSHSNPHISITDFFFNK